MYCGAGSWGSEKPHVLGGIYVDSTDTDEEFPSLALIPEAWRSPVCGHCLEKMEILMGSLTSCSHQKT